MKYTSTAKVESLKISCFQSDKLATTRYFINQNCKETDRKAWENFCFEDFSNLLSVYKALQRLISHFFFNVAQVTLF